AGRTPSFCGRTVLFFPQPPRGGIPSNRAPADTRTRSAHRNSRGADSSWTFLQPFRCAGISILDQAFFAPSDHCRTQCLRITFEHLVRTSHTRDPSGFQPYHPVTEG